MPDPNETEASVAEVTDEQQAEGGFPEGWPDEEDAELQDPEFQLEATTTSLRNLWANWMCRKGGGTFNDIDFFGKKIGGVPTPAVDAFRALEQALTATGYRPKSRWAYNCRKIGGSQSYSLHSAGIAIDIDPKENPYSSGDKYSGALKEHHVSAVLAIKNTAGQRVFAWGGNWKKHDRMHFQLDAGPSDVAIDWSTVPGGKAAVGDTATATQPVLDSDEEGQVLKKGSGGKAVTQFQKAILAWDPNSLPKYGADGDYGDETIAAVKAFQKENGLEETGHIDGVTAVLLGGRLPA